MELDPVNASGRVLLATIGTAHGVRGEVRVKTFTEDPAALGGYGPLNTEDGRVFQIERLRPAKEVVVAKFRGIDDRNAAEALNGISLYVDREHLPNVEADEYYHADLIGLSAEAEAGEQLGTVVAVHDFGAGDILEIAPRGGPSLLVPFTKEAVPLIDIAAARVVIVPPDETEAPEEEDEA
jgi:16S rRNA processing protein RimM